MELSDLRAIVREDRFADVYDNPTPDTDSQRWTDAFIDRNLNEAERAACRGSDLLFDTTSAVTDLSLVAGTPAYSLDPKITRLENILLDEEPLLHVTEDELVAQWGLDWRAEEDDPVCFWVKGRTITFVPNPVLSAEVKLEIFRLPLTAMVDDADEPEIPEEFHEALCYFAEHRGYLRKDEDTYDPNKANQRLAAFHAVFGRPVPAELRAHHLEQPKNTSFRIVRSCTRRSRSSQQWR